MKIATVITLKYKNKADEKPESYQCKVIEKEDDYFLIDYPIHTQTKKTRFFQVNTPFIASYIGEDNAIYEFPTQIVERVKLNIPALRMVLPEKSEFKRIQRREFVRVDASIDTAVHSPEQVFKPFTAISIDISGGGVSFLNPDKLTLNMGEQLDIWLALAYQSGEIYYINTKAKIVFFGTRNNFQTVAVQFIDLQVMDQQMIVRYTFEKQREMRQRE